MIRQPDADALDDVGQRLGGPTTAQALRDRAHRLGIAVEQELGRELVVHPAIIGHGSVETRQEPPPDTSG